jgi:hypothetical protein
MSVRRLSNAVAGAAKDHTAASIGG